MGYAKFYKTELALRTVDKLNSPNYMDNNINN